MRAEDIDAGAILGEFRRHLDEQAAAAAQAAERSENTRGMAEHPEVRIEAVASGRVIWADFADFPQLGALFTNTANRAMAGADVRSAIGAAAVAGDRLPQVRQPSVPEGYRRQSMRDDADLRVDDSEEAEWTRYELAVQAGFLERDPKHLATVKRWAPGGAGEVAAVLRTATPGYPPTCQVEVASEWRTVPNGGAGRHFLVGHKISRILFLNLSGSEHNGIGLAAKTLWTWGAAVDEDRKRKREDEERHGASWRESGHQALTFDRYPALDWGDQSEEAAQPRKDFQRRLKVTTRLSGMAGPA